MAAFISYLHKKHLMKSTIQAKLSAISAVHKIHSVKDPTNSYLVKQSLKGASKLQKFKPSKLLPINKQLLHQMLTTVKRMLSEYDSVLFQCIYLLSYYCCLRVSEIADCKLSSHTLQLEDFSIQSSPYPLLIQVNFSSYKHSDSPVSLVLHPLDSVFCPVAALLKYVAIRGESKGPLFLTFSKLPLSRQYFSKVMKGCINSLGIDSKFYNTHSFRIGRATDLATLGVSPHIIKAAGRWRSEAYQKYIRLAEISFPDV